jgi:hypothetical protein
MNDYRVVLSSVLYLIHPEPWVTLPVNGVLFGIAVVTIRRLLTAICGSPAAALVATAPFFLFPSFVAMWGQPQKDLNTGVGLSLVLCALVLANKRGRGSRRATEALWLAVLATGGMGVIWLSRPYVLSLVAAATVVFVAVAFLGKGCQRARLSAVAMVVVVTAMPNVVGWASVRSQIKELLVASPAERMGATTPLSLEENCLPLSTGAIFDTVLFNLCHIREGFIADGRGAEAASGFDHDIRLRSTEDFIAYAPRAVAVTILEPAPWQWRTGQTAIGKLGSVFVPFEMIAAYVSFLLVLLFAPRRLARPEVVAVVAFCITYSVFFVLASPQMGTLYRMRAFAFAIVVSTALALVLARPKVAGSIT